LATEIGCNGGKEAGNALVSREIVQARLPASLWSRKEPCISRPI